MTSWLNEHIVLRHSLIMVILGSLALSLWNAAYGLSLFFGGAMGVLTFKMLCLDASRVLRLAPGTAQRAARRGYFRRLFFYGAALSISLQQNMLSFGWTFVGLLIPKLVIYGLLVLRRIRSGK